MRLQLTILLSLLFAATLVLSAPAPDSSLAQPIQQSEQRHPLTRGQSTIRLASQDGTATDLTKRGLGEWMADMWEPKIFAAWCKVKKVFRHPCPKGLVEEDEDEKEEEEEEDDEKKDKKKDKKKGKKGKKDD